MRPTAGPEWSTFCSWTSGAGSCPSDSACCNDAPPGTCSNELRVSGRSVRKFRGRSSKICLSRVDSACVKVPTTSSYMPLYYLQMMQKNGGFYNKGGAAMANFESRLAIRFDPSILNATFARCVGSPQFIAFICSSCKRSRDFDQGLVLEVQHCQHISSDEGSTARCITKHSGCLCPLSSEMVKCTLYC
jgi:hypothetical protein